jgi:hypothetical protein
LPIHGLPIGDWRLEYRSTNSPIGNPSIDNPPIGNPSIVNPPIGNSSIANPPIGNLHSAIAN